MTDLEFSPLTELFEPISAGMEVQVVPIDGDEKLLVMEAAQRIHFQSVQE